MKQKDVYIRDDGVVRLCPSNVAKMNLFECMYYHLPRMRYQILDVANDIVHDVLPTLLNIALIIILPISYPIMALIEIRTAKKFVADEKQRKSDLSTIDEDIKSIIRSISSSLARAKSAKTDENSTEELKHLLRATNSIILLVKLDDVGADIQKEYASVLVDSSARIRDILLAGGTI